MTRSKHEWWPTAVLCALLSVVLAAAPLPASALAEAFGPGGLTVGQDAMESVDDAPDPDSAIAVSQAYDGSRTFSTPARDANVSVAAVVAAEGLELLDAIWEGSEPRAAWNQGPDGTDRYEVQATVTKADGNQVTSAVETVEQSPYTWGGNSYDFGDFVEEQGDGSYVFDVTAYNAEDVAIARGQRKHPLLCKPMRIPHRGVLQQPPPRPERPRFSPWRGGRSVPRRHVPLREENALGRHRAVYHRFPSSAHQR